MKIHIWLQSLGIAMLFFSALFWGATGRQSVLMMMCAVTLVALGAYQGAKLPSLPPER